MSQYEQEPNKENADTKANRCEPALALIRLEIIKEGMKESSSRRRGGKHLMNFKMKSDHFICKIIRYGCFDNMRQSNISGCPFQWYTLSSTKSTQFASNRIFGSISYPHIH